MNNIAKNLTRLIALLLLISMAVSMVSCDNLPFGNGNEGSGNENNENGENGGNDQLPDDDENPGTEEIPGTEENPGENAWGEEYKDQIITIAEALEICKQHNGEASTERYYIRGFISSIDNATYGAMTVADETGSISVYGSNAPDGTGYNQMADKPFKGDEVILSCTLQIFNGTEEVKNAIIVDFRHVEAEIDPSEYTEMSIADAREAEVGVKVKVSGVVARLTYANGMIPSGAIVVDETSSIYVYDRDFAARVAIGDAVELCASKTYWVLDDEKNNADKFGYNGANQLKSVVSVNISSHNNKFDKSWITETTVKEIIETPVTENITNKIFKVNALVNKVPGTGFVNYYINDLDGVTGSYTYTQCNGGDFGWLDEFDGKICTVYMVVINAKSTVTGCVWRLLPVEVIDEGYVFDTAKTAEHAVKYYGVDQFISRYTGDPELELVGSVSSQLLGFEGATLSYASDNESVVYFTTDENGVVTFHCGDPGKANVTVTATYGENTYSENVEIVVVPNVEVEHVGVADAISAENNTTVTVKGIVGPSLVNQTGFYLIDSTGSIPVRIPSTAFEGLAIGQEVIVQGTRTITKDGGGQICIDSATIVANYYGSHDYSDASFITGKTITEIYAVADSTEATTRVYVTTGKIYVSETPYSVTVQVQDPDATSTYVLLYSGSKDQYNWLKAYNGTTITVELALCDWNAKGLKGCVLAVITDDGKIYNTLNFN